MGSSRSPGPALVAAAADADPVTLLVTAWLSARRSENTRAGYARDIGITPPRRPGRAPSWLAWCQQQGVHPVTGVTALHVARYARQLEAAGLSPASAARKLAAISSWYAWLARRGHISASPAAGIARPRPGPRTLPAPALTPGQALALMHAADTAPGAQRARTAALTAVLLYTGARLSEVTGADVTNPSRAQAQAQEQIERAHADADARVRAADDARDQAVAQAAQADQRAAAADARAETARAETARAREDATRELEQLRADAAREREELRGAMESRAQVLEESRDELRARAERAERELDRLRTGEGQGGSRPARRQRGQAPGE